MVPLRFTQIFASLRFAKTSYSCGTLCAGHIRTKLTQMTVLSEFFQALNLQRNIIMLTINEVRVEEIFQPSKIPDIDFESNPYIGCTYNCIYCYAGYVQDKTGREKKWGSLIIYFIQSFLSIL